MKLSFEELKSESSPPDFITKNKILDHVSQEEMFEKYSGETISNEQFCSKLRIDNKPGCNWKYSESGVLYHVDWAKGEWLDVFQASSSLSEIVLQELEFLEASRSLHQHPRTNCQYLCEWLLASHSRSMSRCA